MTEQQKIQVHNALFGMEFKPLTVHRCQWILKDNEENLIYSVLLTETNWSILHCSEGDYSEEGFAKLLKTIQELV